MIACSIGSLPIVNACLHYGAIVHTKDTAGRTPLHYCAAIGSIEIFEKLIEKGSNPLELTIGGETPLAKACMFCQGDIIEWYLNSALNAFEIQDKCGKKPLEILKLSG
jgi:ankyrin repeat protein